MVKRLMKGDRVLVKFGSKLKPVRTIVIKRRGNEVTVRHPASTSGFPVEAGLNKRFVKRIRRI